MKSIPMKAYYLNSTDETLDIHHLHDDRLSSRIYLLQQLFQ
jgi:hypothetical protein